MSSKDTSVYPIGVVEKITGLTGRRIRYYEETGLIHPERTAGKQRLYSRADVERLQEIKKLLADGFNLAGIRAQLESRPQANSAEEQEHPEMSLHLQRSRLNSLYPVSNRADLEKVLEEFQFGEDEKK